jgi:hypothetical protein
MIGLFRFAAKGSKVDSVSLGFGAAPVFGSECYCQVHNLLRHVERHVAG